MEPIRVEKPGPEEVKALGVETWPVWQCGVSTFPWTYDEAETAYLVEGRVHVTAEGQGVTLVPGDLVHFPRGLHCTWEVEAPVRKHYRFA